MYLAEGAHQSVGLPRARLPEGKDSAGEAAGDAEPQAWPQAVAQGCHLPARPWHCRPARVGWAEGWGPCGALRDSPVYRQLHQLPHAAALEHSLLRVAGVKHGAEPEGGILPGCTHLGTGTAGAQEGPQPPTAGPQQGGGPYMDGAVAEAVHNPPVPSPRLRAGQWPDPNGVCGVHGSMGTPGSPAVPVPWAGGSPMCPQAHCVPSYLSTTLRRVSLPTAGSPCSSPGLLWEQGQRDGGCSPGRGGMPMGIPGDRVGGEPGSCWAPPVLPSPLRPRARQGMQ